MKISILLLFGAFLATDAAAETPDQIPAPPRDVRVVNTPSVVIDNNSSEPVPVVGDVNVTGEVDLTGAVDVGSIPDSLTEQIDTLIEKVDNMNDALINSQGQPASYVKNFSFETSAIGSKSFRLFDYDLYGDNAFVMVSTMTISAENDSGYIRLVCAGGPGSSCNDMYIGSPDKEFPGVLVLPFPQPVPMKSFQWSCKNNVEDCEIRVSVVGTFVPDHDF